MTVPISSTIPVNILRCTILDDEEDDDDDDGGDVGTARGWPTGTTNPTERDEINRPGGTNPRIPSNGTTINRIIITLHGIVVDAFIMVTARLECI